MHNQTVTRHRVIYITYSIINAHGQLVEQCDLPVGYVHGAGSDLFEKIECALEGRSVGEQVEITLSPDESFGDHQAGLTYTDDIDNVPPEYRCLGAQVEFQNERGETLLFSVSKIENGRLTLDANHPLAGQTVTFVIRIVSVRDATLDEIANGLAHSTLH